MSDTFVERETTGFLSNMGRSVMAVPIGILLFLLSFVVFWKTEGRTDWSKVAGSSVVASADAASGQDGKFVSITGPLTSSEKLGDPEFIGPGDYIRLYRSPQMYAWVEDRKTESKKKVGGKTEKVTTYNYETRWTNSPKSSGDFKYPQGHENPTMSVTSQEFVVKTASVGAWSFPAGDAGLPGLDELPLTESVKLKGKGASGQKIGNEVFLGTGTTDVPKVGDIKVSWTALPSGQTVTLFGQASGGTLGAYMHKGEDRFFRALRGNRGEAIAALKSEYKTMGWVGRVVGFLMMWIGMTMVFTPLHALLDVIPFLGSISRNLLGCALFPVALVLSAISILISMLLHSIVAMLVITLLLGGLGFYAWKKKQEGVS